LYQIYRDFKLLEIDFFFVNHVQTTEITRGSHIILIQCEWVQTEL